MGYFAQSHDRGMSYPPFYVLFELQALNVGKYLVMSLCFPGTSLFCHAYATGVVITLTEDPLPDELVEVSSQGRLI